MKNIILAILLVALVASNTCADGCCDNNGGSFPVNSPVIIQTPPTIAPPACAIPTVTPPVISPPTVNIPTIDAPCVNVPTLTPPSVVAPPTVTPPTVNIPTVNPPYIPPVGLPPQVPPPTTLPNIPLPPVISLPTPPPSNCPSQLSNSFTLSLQWACREGVAFNSCLGDVVFNNVIVASIVPTDYLIHSLSVQVTVKPGKNSLQIEGTGTSDSYGLTVDNVALVRQGSSNSIVVNGGFESPNQFGSWNIYNDIAGWKGTGIEIGRGTIYNHLWTSQVCELDGNANFEITQYFVFDTNYNIITDDLAACSNPFPGKTLTYTLEFDWSARTNGPNNYVTSQGNVLWNNVVIGSLYAADANIHHSSFSVTLNSGDNILQFDGTSVSDSYGLVIDNVKLTSSYNGTNLIVNGNFQAPALATGSWTYINGGILGWSAAKAEVGDCRIYNNNWGVSQCIELDSDSNQRYTQVISISNQLYSSLIIYIDSVLGNSANLQTVNLATQNANQAISTSVANINSAIQCSVAFTAWNFNHYIQDLYHCANAQVQNVLDNQYLTISQYSCGSSQWLQYFGQSGELDFQCDGYDQNQLTNSWCTIISINGKVVNCRGDSGDYHLQISPCSHFEGQHELPHAGDKIFWKGSQSSSGNVYVMVATTCDC